MFGLESINNIITLREIIGTIIGALAGGWLTYLGAIRIQRFSMRENAKDEFRRVMMPYYVNIKNRFQKCPYFILTNNGTHSQLLAYYHFKVSIAWYRRPSFDSAWKNYFGTANDRFPHQYHEHPEDDTYCEKMFDIAEHRLKDLLNFT